MAVLFESMKKRARGRKCWLTVNKAKVIKQGTYLTAGSNQVHGYQTQRVQTSDLRKLLHCVSKCMILLYSTVVGIVSIPAHVFGEYTNDA